ncbi:hypothetical protein [Peterkaempfera griseoplana]|uniref:hypothetical protein n=1 Tax=Peterkaempfera griseoplana TaxID=66896 RepID=UPI0006E3CCA6|nr:hypothetical protein [Peterkaempfera griseoplana]
MSAITTTATTTATISGPATADSDPATATAPGSTDGATGSGTAAAAYPTLPVWFFGFEGVLASSFDIFKAYPPAAWLLGALVAVNITVSLTVMRRRVKLAKALWRGKGTRKVAVALLALRMGLHAVLSAVGLAVASVTGHLMLAAVMGAVTVWLLWFAQRTALRALAAQAV